MKSLIALFLISAPAQALEVGQRVEIPRAALLCRAGRETTMGRDDIVTIATVDGVGPFSGSGDHLCGMIDSLTGGTLHGVVMLRKELLHQASIETQVSLRLSEVPLDLSAASERPLR